MTELDPNQLAPAVLFSGGLLWLIRTVGVSLVEVIRGVTSAVAALALKVEEVHATVHTLVQYPERTPRSTPVVKGKKRSDTRPGIPVQTDDDE